MCNQTYLNYYVAYSGLMWAVICWHVSYVWVYLSATWACVRCVRPQMNANECKWMSSTFRLFVHNASWSWFVCEITIKQLFRNESSYASSYVPIMWAHVMSAQVALNGSTPSVRLCTKTNKKWVKSAFFPYFELFSAFWAYIWAGVRCAENW